MENCRLSLADLKDVVYRAGNLIRDVHEAGEIIAKEGPANFVTRYDSAVQAFLIKELSAILPEAKFLAEEDGMTDTDPSEGYVFIIDPIDGTTNFICDFQCSGICVALAYNGELQLGVVYNPYQEEMYSAEKGQGAYLNHRRIQMPDRELEEGVMICGGCSPYPEIRDLVFDTARELYPHTMDIRELGSAAMGLCYVAAGRGIIYMNAKLYAWDYAAAQLIIQEAGGVVCGYDGEPLKLCSHVAVIGSTPKAREQFLELTKKIREKYRKDDFLIHNI